MPRNYPSRATYKRRRRVAAAILTTFVLLAAGVAVSQAGVLEGDVDAIAAPGRPVETAIRGFNRAEARRVRQAVSTPTVLGIPRARLDAIASCESHGDPSAVSSDGTYRGKYQFHRGTWASVGPVGDPIRASEPEQDRRAALLIKRSGGASPWPECGS